MSKSNHRSQRGVITKDRVELQNVDSIIPDADTMERMEAIVPGATNRWMNLAESEVKTRQINERDVISTYKWATLTGTFSALLIPLAIVISAIYCLYQGEFKIGAIIITGGVAQTITAYVVRNKDSKPSK